MLLLVSSGGAECLLGVEPLAVRGREGGVGSGAAFEFADAHGDGAKMLGGLGEGQYSRVVDTVLDLIPLRAFPASTAAPLACLS